MYISKSVKAPLSTQVVYKGATKPAQKERDPTNPRDPKNFPILLYIYIDKNFPILIWINLLFR